MKINRLQSHFFLPSLYAFSLLPSYAFAVEESLCRVSPSSIIQSDTFSTDGKIHLQSDKVSYHEKDISRFEGNVVIQQKETRIETGQAEYNKQNEKIKAKGNVTFISPSIKIKSKSANFNLKTEQAVLQQSEYKSLTSRARGNATKIEIKDSNITELSDATYTTCDPNNADWLLSADKIRLDNTDHQGHASNVVLRFKGVPFFYFPYLRFPLGEDRLSGFLFPDLGHSNEHGNEFKIPYYWNIHPQLDATITPWYMSKRGTLLNTEVRYLTENNNGILTAEVLNNDKKTNSDREQLYWKHQSQPALGWQANVEYNYVADNNHLIDFSDSLSSTSATYLVRTGNAAYNSQNWLLNVKADDHQILSGANPYKRLPQITLNSRYAITNNALNFSFQSEAVRFSHEDNKVIGERLHFKPSITYPIKSAAGFFEPKLSLQYTNYNLDQTAGETNLSRSVPTFSLNSGLFFERDTVFFNQSYIQTLEPQLFYVYTPYQDQSNIPIFDTSVYAFNLNNSFSDYRYNSIDRIGDDNRVTAALATRYIDQNNGQEKFMARIGQVYYFTDRKVQLPSATVDTAERSHIIAEVKTTMDSWSLSSQAEWSEDLKDNVSTSSQLSYKYKKFNFNLAHRFQLNVLETHEMKINWDLSSRWKINASHLFDFKGNHVVENLMSINYESCCWGLNLSTKERYISSSQTDRGIYLELVLKGLGGFTYSQ